MLADAVEDDHRVVDRVADDREQGGEEDAVELLAEPGEHAQEDRHVLEHGSDRGGRVAPPEPDGEVHQLRCERQAERDQGLLAELAPDGGPDELVTHLGCAPGRGLHGFDDAVLLVGAELTGPDADVPVPGRLDDGARQPAGCELVADLIQVSRAGCLVLEQPASRELQPVGEPSGGDPGTGEHQRHSGDGEPQLAPTHQVRPTLGQPGAEPAAYLQTERPGTHGQPTGPEEQLHQGAGHHEGGEHRNDHTERQRDAEAPNGTRCVEEEQPGGDQRRRVRVSDRRPGAAEAGNRRLAGRTPC